MPRSLGPSNSCTSLAWSEHLNRWPHAFSGGQRVGIARVSLNPECIICDEPVGSRCFGASTSDESADGPAARARCRCYSLPMTWPLLATSANALPSSMVANWSRSDQLRTSSTDPYIHIRNHSYRRFHRTTHRSGDNDDKRRSRHPDITRRPSAQRHRERFPDHAAAFADEGYGWQQVSPEHGVRCSDLDRLRALQNV